MQSFPMTRIHHRRPGFSLIELLVVISIITLLLALTAGTIFRVRDGQLNRASIATINKVQGALDNRVKAIRDSAKDEIRKQSTPAAKAAISDAGGDLDIALTLLLYAKMKNELPMTVAEATTDTQVGNIQLRRRAPFTTAFAGLTGATGTPEESGVCLFIALTNSGGDGAAVDAGLDQQAINTPIPPPYGTSSYRTFGDAWGTPLAFVRHCYATELQAKPYVQTATPKDPYDQSPNSKALAALSTRWGSTTTPNTILFGVPTFAGMPSTYDRTKNHVPTVVSAGPNLEWGNDMFSAEDNLYGFRLRREGSTGN